MPNPKKVTGNQYVADPRQSIFLSHFLDPKSKTFSNAYQSAILAGYEEEYAKVITGQMPKWLSESLSKFSMVEKAERNLDKILDLETKEKIIGMFGPLIDKKTKQPFEKENPNLLRVKADVSKFVAERLAKEKYGESDKTKPINLFVQIVGMKIIKDDGNRIQNEE